MTWLGLPIRRREERRAWGTLPCLGLGLATMLTVDLLPPTWIGLVLLVVLVMGIGVVVARAARSTTWGRPGHRPGQRRPDRACARRVPGAYATCVDMIAKLAQNAVLLALVLVVVILAIRAAQPERVDIT